MPYLHKQKWGAVEQQGRRSLVIDPHMYSAAVGTIRQTPKKAKGAGGLLDVAEDGRVLFWRSKTKSSSYAEWMELHDATDGATLWRAEARYADRAAPVPTDEGGANVEFLTSVRLYLEHESRPRLMIVHRDANPGGLGTRASRTLAVYTLDPDQSAQEPAGGVPPDPNEARVAKPAGPPPTNPAIWGPSGRPQASGAALQEPADQFDFADLPQNGDIFQLTLNQSLTTVALTAVTLQNGQVRGLENMRTLARMKRSSTGEPRTLEIDGGLDVPLVTMLLTTVDQLLLSHDAVDYDVAWPDDYGFANGECFSSRKTEARNLKLLADNANQTDDDRPWAMEPKGRMCFGLF